MNNKEIESNSIKSVKTFTLLISLYFGFFLFQFVIIHFFGLIYKLIGISLIMVNYENIDLLQEFYFLILMAGILISLHKIRSFKKNGIIIFLIFFVAAIINKIFRVPKEWSDNNAMGVASLLFSFIIDLIIAIYFLKVFLKNSVRGLFTNK